jgi:hypothetical protein
MSNFHKKIISELKKSIHSANKLQEQTAQSGENMVPQGLSRSGSIKGKEYQIGNDAYHVFYNKEKSFWQVCKRPSMAPEKEFKGGDADTNPDEVWQAFLAVKER